MLPMIPVYLTYFAGGEGGKKGLLRHALAFVLGFTVVFVLLGAFIGTLGSFLIEYRREVNWVTGGMVILFGLNYLNVIRIPFLNRQSGRTAATGEITGFSAFLFGLVFSLAWTPCVGVFLGSALMLASLSGSTMQGVYMLLLYSAGLGIPFILSALLMERMKAAFALIKRHYRVINTASGILLIIVGLFMATGYMGRLLTYLSF